MDELTHEIAERLRPVCAELPDDELWELAAEMARVQRKYERLSMLDFVGRSFRRAEFERRLDGSFER